MYMSRCKEEMTIEKLFFELLQVAIGNRDTLSVVPTKEQWAEIFALSKKQALAAVAFAGVNRLKEACSESNGFGGSIGIDEMTYLKWLGLTAKIAQKNKALSDACASLCKDLAHDGLYACILKGQSNLINYPEELRDCRTPGDIDVWCGLMDPEGIDIAVADLDGNGAHYEKYADERGVIEWVLADYRIRDKKMPEVNFHHVDWEYQGVECEVHFKPSWMNNPFHNARLQKWCKKNEQWNTYEYNGFNIPSVGFNAVYQLVHIYRHLFNEGIGLRQLLDYYFVLKSLSVSPLKGESPADDSSCKQTMGMWEEGLGISKISKEEILQTISHLGMKPFASAVMWVLTQVFEPSHDNDDDTPRYDNWASRWPWVICKPDAKRGEFLLNEIMLAGNFGKYDSRNVISTNEGYLKRFVRRQRRFLRFLTQYPSEVLCGPYFSVKQRVWRMWHGWR